jgi:V8-like Glu-specific endopeptidase
MMTRYRLPGAVTVLLSAALAVPSSASSSRDYQTLPGSPAGGSRSPTVAAPGGPQIVSLETVSGKGPSAKIVNGSPTTWYPSVGTLLLWRGEGYELQCTATLIGCHTVLTAAHCIADAPNKEDYGKYRMFFQEGGVAEIASIEWQPKAYVSPDERGATADIAILKLKQPITGIAPAPINEAREHAPDIKGKIVGFGRTRGAAPDYGLKRFGEIKAAACGGGTDSSDLLCWNYRGQADANTCDGDSGGPLFLSEGRPAEVVSGVTSGGSPDCSPVDHSYDTSVFHYRSWIKHCAREALASTCGDVPVLTDTDQRYRSVSGVLDNQNSSIVLAVEIRGVQELRVAANVGHPIGQETAELALPELHVLSGRSQDLAGGKCSGVDDAPAAFCATRHPTDGVYTIVLKRANDRGVANFQLVLSAF